MMRPSQTSQTVIASYKCRLGTVGDVYGRVCVCVCVCVCVQLSHIPCPSVTLHLTAPAVSGCSLAGNKGVKSAMQTVLAAGAVPHRCINLYTLAVYNFLVPSLLGKT